MVAHDIRLHIHADVEQAVSSMSRLPGQRHTLDRREIKVYINRSLTMAHAFLRFSSSQGILRCCHKNNRFTKRKCIWRHNITSTTSPLAVNFEFSLLVAIAPDGDNSANTQHFQARAQSVTFRTYILDEGRPVHTLPKGDNIPKRVTAWRKTNVDRLGRIILLSVHSTTRLSSGQRNGRNKMAARHSA